MQSLNPILWDFQRVLPNETTDIGGLVEYADTKGQSIFMESTNVSTAIYTVSQGDWQDATVDTHTTLFSNQFSQTSWDIPCIETLVGVSIGISDSKLQYLRILGDRIRSI